MNDQWSFSGYELSVMGTSCIPELTKSGIMQLCRNKAEMPHGVSGQSCNPDMSMLRKICSALLLVLSMHYSALGDAFPKSPRALGGPVLSIELLGSYEYAFREKGNLLVWGGGAVVFSPLYLEINGGPEAALELRHYFIQKENKMWSISLYSGVAYSFIGEQYGAFTPGLKLTRKKIISPLIQSEPYISLSYPFYFDGGHPFLPFLTFGYRFVFEKKTQKQVRRTD